MQTPPHPKKIISKWRLIFRNLQKYSRAASSVDSITDYNGFYLLSRHAARVWYGHGVRLPLAFSAEVNLIITFLALADTCILSIPATQRAK